MARTFLRLRPDGIYEIVSPHRVRRLTSALGAVLFAATFGLVVAAALTVFAPRAGAILGGAGLTAVVLLVVAVRAQIRNAARPLACTIPLRARSARVLAEPDTARDAGA